MDVMEGDPAPDFILPASDGRTVSLSRMKGRAFILYFYPKADAPGCTRQACLFEEAGATLGKLGLDIVGVSADKTNTIDIFAA